MACCPSVRGRQPRAGRSRWATGFAREKGATGRTPRRHQTCHFGKSATSVPAEGPAHELDFARHCEFPLPALQALTWHVHGSRTFGATRHTAHAHGGARKRPSTFRTAFWRLAAFRVESNERFQRATRQGLGRSLAPLSVCPNRVVGMGQLEVPTRAESCFEGVGFPPYMGKGLVN